jgi:citrate lyase beta subunit
MNVVPYHFIKYFEDGFDQYFQKLQTDQSVVVLDLEDSIINLHEPYKTAQLKEQYRGYIYTLSSHFFSAIGCSLGLRINSIQTAEFAKDVCMLRELAYNPFDTLIIPKVDSARQLQHYIVLFEQNEIHYRELIVLIETRQGFHNLEEILQTKSTKFNKVIFGHADLNYDLDRFPFFHQNNLVYWKYADYLLAMTEKYTVGYINSPCFFLDDMDMFRYTLNRIYAKRQQPFGQMTLNTKQTQACIAFEFIPELIDTFLFEPYHELPEDELVAYAENIIYRVEQFNQCKGLTIDNHQCLVTPQEYFKANQVLHENNQHINRVGLYGRAG